MKIIGITGGVGSGKSEVLRYLEEKYGAVVCEADLVAKNLQKKGTICYNKIVEHFGEDILDENGRIDRPHLARIVFKDDEELHVLNAIVHPAVKENIRRKIRQEIKQGTELFVLRRHFSWKNTMTRSVMKCGISMPMKKYVRNDLNYPEDIVKRRSRICSVHRKAGMNFWSTATVQ